MSHEGNTVLGRHDFEEDMNIELDKRNSTYIIFITTMQDRRCKCDKNSQ